MANRINVGFNTIFKRSSCLNASSDEKQIDAGKRFKLLESQLKSVQDGRVNILTLKSSINSYIESLVDPDNANHYYRDPLYLMQEINQTSKEISSQILKEYTARILPYVEDLSNISESVNRYNITDEQKSSIIEAAIKYIAADRILLNHEKISKRFNISQEITKVRSRGLKPVVESCCSMIDTYTINPYAKMNLCLEEISYLLDKEGIPYSKKKLVTHVTEYFLLRSANLSPRDIKGFKTVLNENCYITEEDISEVDYIQSDLVYNRDTASIKNEIKYFLLKQTKTLEDLEDITRNSMRSSILDITTNINKLLWLIFDVYKSSIFDNSATVKTIGNCFNIMLRRFEDELNRSISQEDLNRIIDQITNFKNILVSINGDDYETISKYAVFKNLVTDFIESISVLSNISYSSYNLESLEFVNGNQFEAIPVNEFKIFKFHNLVRASMNLDKFLKYKSKQIYEKGNKKVRKVVKKIKDVLFGESTDIYSYIGEDNKADITVAQFIFDEGSYSEMVQFFEEICKEFNGKLLCENIDTVKCYYYMISNEIAEIHLKEATPIIIENSDASLIRRSDYSDFDIYVEEFSNVCACMNSFDLYTESELDIESRLAGFFENENLTLEHYEIMMEALSLLNVEKESVSVFSESFKGYRRNKMSTLNESSVTEREIFMEGVSIDKINESWEKINDIPLIVQLEAFQILDAVLEEDGAKKDNPNTAVDETRKNPFKGINLNSMKLYLQGLKTKMKQMSSKEKEFSRNIDNMFRRFVKSMKDALISDRREAIIKGSVIPSFSKCVKICVGLAGLGVVTGNPLIPLLAAFAGFSASKRLTKKERILLLDEIETELEVLEKEISIAESKNQMKKLRTLLNYKKDLQRQYQRIRYNVRVGKDILPGSTVGVKNFNN